LLKTTEKRPNTGFGDRLSVGMTCYILDVAVEKREMRW